MNNPTTKSLDDGQPLVEFAPLKPAEHTLRRAGLGSVLLGNPALRAPRAVQPNSEITR